MVARSTTGMLGKLPWCRIVNVCAVSKLLSVSSARCLSGWDRREHAFYVLIFFTCQSLPRAMPSLCRREDWVKPGDAQNTDNSRRARFQWPVGRDKAVDEGRNRPSPITQCRYAKRNVGAFAIFTSPLLNILMERILERDAKCLDRMRCDRVRLYVYRCGWCFTQNGTKTDLPSTSSLQSSHDQKLTKSCTTHSSPTCSTYATKMQNERAFSRRRRWKATQ